jgi:CheY-like chemotaxis protein
MNARKYGALSVSTGQLCIDWAVNTGGQRELLLKWQESGVPNVSAPRSRGFGSTLIERTLEANRGKALFRYAADGLTCEINLPLAEEASESIAHTAAHMAADVFWKPRKGSGSDLRGKRVLLIEDEPLVGMEMESELRSQGFEVIGPATHIESANRLIAENTFDAALVDANLDGHSAEEIAAALAQKGIPFAFATGYGRDALPEPFRDAVILAKPFGADRLTAVVQELLARNTIQSEVVPLRSRKS